MIEIKGHLRKRNNKYYAIVYIPGPDGKPVRKEIATKQEKQKEAQKVLNNILVEIQNNSFVVPDKITVESYLKKWLEINKKRLSPTTLDSYEIVIYNHIIPFFKNTPFQKVTPLMVSEYYNSKLETLSGKTVHQHHRIFKKALQDAVKMQLLSKNPCEYADPPKVKKYHAEVLKPEEIEPFLMSFKNNKYEIIVHLALVLGLRRGEIFGLRWSDIDFKNGTLTIKQTLVRTKTGTHFKEPKSETSRRTLNIPKSLITMLKSKHLEYKEKKLEHGPNFQDYDLVVCDEAGQPLNPDSFSRRFLEHIEKHNLPRIRFHDLRHSNATLMLKANIAPKVASQRLGHSTIGITMDLYSHVLNEMDKEVSDKMDEIIYGN